MGCDSGFQPQLPYYGEWNVFNCVVEHFCWGSKGALIIGVGVTAVFIGGYIYKYQPGQQRLISNVTSTPSTTSTKQPLK